MTQLTPYLQYIEPCEVPFSAAVYLIKGEQNTYVYDVGRDPMNLEILSEIKNIYSISFKIQILS